MRESGILMHISSLPGPYGIGTMGRAAYAFVDFLYKAGQSCWQLLPVSPTGYGNSPYQSVSSHAGNPYLIDLGLLVEEGLLLPNEPEAFEWGRDARQVDFGAMYEKRLNVLRLAFRRFAGGAEYAAFLEENARWLPDYALFMALKEEQGGTAWLDWPEGLRLREAGALEAARQRLADTIALHYFLQYLFQKQWQALHDYAGSKGIRIIGDVPIYVPLDSADVWAAPELFQLDEDRKPTAVAGCPPDAFTADGQLWGNPLYRWEVLEETDYGWWIDRLQSAKRRYDCIRLDHFRGFESYWSVPYGDETAAGGHWEKGPGMEFVCAIQNAMPDLDCIAEDLGFLTPEVRDLLEESGFPGMKVLEFAFDSREESDYLPHRYPVDSVCYTGTHDNVTLAQWFREAAEADVACAKDYLGLNREEGYTWGMIRGGMSSVSQLFVAQMQDYLELGGFARMNFPGHLLPQNWVWRAEPGFDSAQLAEKIAAMTRRYGRLSAKVREEEEQAEALGKVETQPEKEPKA